MKSFFITMLFILISLFTYANGGFYTPGKTGILIPSKNEYVGMEEEVIKIRIRRLTDYIYESSFSCMYILKNNSKANQDILVGFPIKYGESSYGENKTRLDCSFIYDFTVSVDNKKTGYQWFLHGHNPELPNISGYDDVYAFDVDFKKSEERIILIKYKVIAHEGMGGSFINYILKSGNTWCCPIKKADVYIIFTYPVAYTEKYFEKYAKGGVIKKTVSTDITFHFHFKEFVPENDIRINLRAKDMESENKKDYSFDDAIEQLQTDNTILAFYRANIKLKYNKDNELDGKKYELCKKFILEKMKNPQTSLQEINVIYRCITDNAASYEKTLVDQIKMKKDQKTKEYQKEKDIKLNNLNKIVNKHKGEKAYFRAALILSGYDTDNKVARDFFKVYLDKVFENNNLDGLYLADTYLPEHYDSYFNFLKHKLSVYTEEVWQQKKIKNMGKLESVVDIFEEGSYNYGWGDKWLELVSSMSKDLRIANYAIGNHYIRTNQKEAIRHYKAALNYTHTKYYSNFDRIFTLEWIDEGHSNGPCYYIAYNMCCAYALAGESDKAFDWLKAALHMNAGKIKKVAQNDKDIALLRKNIKFNELMNQY